MHFQKKAESLSLYNISFLLWREQFIHVKIGVGVENTHQLHVNRSLLRLGGSFSYPVNQHLDILLWTPVWLITVIDWSALDLWDNN